MISRLKIFAAGPALAALALLLLLLQGCETAKLAPSISATERARIDNAIGTELSRQFDQEIKLKRDVEVSSYLRELCLRLMESSGEMKDHPIGALIMEDKDNHQYSYALPGIRVYFSAGLLKSVEFENELAALAALQLSYVRHRVVLDELKARAKDAPGFDIFDGLTLPQPGGIPGSVVFFGSSGVFNFPKEAHLKAVESAITMMYAAGFDLRGMASMLQRYQANEAASPFEMTALPEMLDKTREVIALHAPLRNPIVRSERFLSIQKRMRKL